jgi:diguanylate cyclase (GGDEF)-like protein
MKEIFQYLERWSTTQLGVLCALVVLFVGFIDFVTGDEIDLTIFYFIPIFVVSWLGRPRLAYLFAAMSALERVVADLMAGHVYANNVIPFWNAVAHSMVFFAIAYAVGYMRRLYDSEVTLSRTDPLTGVANMRRLVDYANTTVARARRHSFDITMVYLDLDNFKWVNDNLGHRVGDEVLIVTANALRESVRAVDMVSRIGGDEFVIFMPEVDHERAVEVIERLHEGVVAEIEQRKWPVTISIGVVTYDSPPNSVSDMIAGADKLMYEAKRAGKNRMVARPVTC